MKFAAVVWLHLLWNKEASQYAICAALIVASLYAFILKPVVRWSRGRGEAMPHVHTAALIETSSHRPSYQPRDTPVRPSMRSSRGFISPVSVGAIPLAETPIFSAPSAAFHKRSGSNGSSSSSATEDHCHITEKSISPTASLPRHAPNALEVHGTPLQRTKEVESVSPKPNFIAAFCRQIQQRRTPLFDTSDVVIRNAVESGEVYIHSSPSCPLPNQEYLAQRLLFRQRMKARYDELDMTESSLKDLYSRPAFHAWYAANRNDLLREMHLRESFSRWWSVAMVVVLAVALMLLPAYSFSTQTDALSWMSPLTSADDLNAIAAAPFAQLLVTRLRDIQLRQSANCAPRVTESRVRMKGVVMAVWNAMECTGIIAAICALATSCFMPHDSGITASLAIASLITILVECAMVPAASLSLGLGFTVVIAVVWKIVQRVASA